MNLALRPVLMVVMLLGNADAAEQGAAAQDTVLQAGKVQNKIAAVQAGQVAGKKNATNRGRKPNLAAKPAGEGKGGAAATPATGGKQEDAPENASEPAQQSVQLGGVRG